MKCDCCEIGEPMHGPDSFCKPCFMLAYEGGFPPRETLRAESLWRRESGFWPWGNNHPTAAQLSAHMAA